MNAARLIWMVLAAVTSIVWAYQNEYGAAQASLIGCLIMSKLEGDSNEKM